jgi:hypothetical protein
MGASVQRSRGHGEAPTNQCQYDTASVYQVRRAQASVLDVDVPYVYVSVAPSKFNMLQDVLARGRARRKTHATGCNDASSRSHELLSFRIAACCSSAAAGSDAATTASPTAGGASFRRLNLVDLAGSERISKSKVEGKQLAEAQAINKSLSALGDVIGALQAGSSHVPYRNSKLTAVLQVQAASFINFTAPYLAPTT